LKNASTLENFGGIISVGAPIDSFVKDDFLVVGTAARQVDPIHGGGIALAMESAIMAAKAVAAANKDYSAEKLKPYEEAWRAGPGKKVAKRLLLRKVMEAATDDDFNHIFKTIKAEDLDQVMQGNFAGSVAKVVAGRPQLVGILGALVTSKKSV